MEGSTDRRGHWAISGASFKFPLAAREFADWKSQIVISNPTAKMGLRKSPLVFTEHGVAMLSSVLQSDRAVQVNIAIVRTFAVG